MSAVEEKQRLQELREEFAIKLMRAEHFYRETKNPVFAWEGLHLSRPLGIGIPAWVSEYLYQCGKSIYQQQQKPSGEATAEVMIALLQFNCSRGKRNSFTEAEKYFNRIALAVMFGKISIEKGKSQTGKVRNKCKIADEVAKIAGTTRANVLRAVDEMNKRFQAALLDENH